MSSKEDGGEVAVGVSKFQEVGSPPGGRHRLHLTLAAHQKTQQHQSSSPSLLFPFPQAPRSPAPLRPQKMKQFLGRQISEPGGGGGGAWVGVRRPQPPPSPQVQHQLTTNSWGSTFHRPIQEDLLSLRSLASLGMGSTDGRKLTIRRVPTSPAELLNIASPQTPCGMSRCSSCGGDSEGEDYEEEEGEGGREGGGVGGIGRRGRFGGGKGAGPGGRDHWANKLQFILACVGYSVGLGNIWRFPYLCYRSGGGVFLVPYYLILLTCGIPLLYMELAVGQFTRRGPIGALSRLCPIFKGAGLSSVVVSFYMSTYYSVIIAYALFYFFTGFRSDSPWSDCGNRWNSPNCWSPQMEDLGSNTTKPNRSKTPAEEFYERKVLQSSSGLEEIGGLRWELAACLLFAWILIYFALWKSVRSSGRVLYFTATFPFLLALVFLARSLTLEGAQLGIDYLFKPQWELLADAKVWVNALAQNFNSFGIAFGSVVSFASYNKHGNRILVDTLTVSAINALTSLLVGLLAFSTIGNIANEHQSSIEDVVSDGPGLVFVVYPQAMSKMPFSNFWAVLFFFMLLCLCLNSQFAIVEVVVTSIQDGFPNWIKRKLVCHEILVLVICVVSFLLGLPHITQGGIYFFQLVDHYAVSNSVMYIAFFEVVAVAWFYGAEKLSKNIEMMTQQKPYLYFRICWTVVAPLLIMCVWIFSLIDYEAPTYKNGSYTYPRWAEVLGWCITSSCLLCIPLLAAYVIARAEGKTFLKKLCNAVHPRLDDAELDERSVSDSKELNNLLEGKFPVEVVAGKGYKLDWNRSGERTGDYPFRFDPGSPREKERPSPFRFEYTSSLPPFRFPDSERSPPPLSPLVNKTP